MADISLWNNKSVRADFETRAKKRLKELSSEIVGLAGVIAIEPDSGDFFTGPTLGKANDAAYVKYPDRWLYFARLDNPEEAIALITW